ncbi:hypothetical protein B5S43_08165 [Gilliamella apicola]|uniref:hypothetical protein n=1 Tax=Gilliamella apicola TaxID=1196095 RepID=UPI000A3574D2|nr:hypothetical protein [Gilliamella apicola]OTQ01078.1 hypothetical protein B5S43_08165 [Gilliamella apicola]OTQ24320.1 hypothetical protein B6D22_04010 [Gilliamella apicola]
MNKKILFLIMLFMSRFAQSQEVTWDLTFDNVYNLPTVIMEFQGEKIPLILDTGSKIDLHLPMALINKIPNKTENSKKIKYIDLSGNTEEARSFIVDKLALDSLIFNNVQVLEYKSWGLFMLNDRTKTDHDKEEIDAEKSLIGLGLFKDYVLTINYPENKITISDDIKVSDDLNKNWFSIPFYLNNYGLVINLFDGSKNYEMILDTGASVSIIKEESLSPSSSKISLPKYNVRYTPLEMTDAASVKVEAIIIDSLPDKFKSDGIIGSNFFRTNIVKIDFRNKQMWVQPVVAE